MIASVTDWAILREESTSDHNYIRFFICQENIYKSILNHSGKRYGI